MRVDWLQKVVNDRNFAMGALRELPEITGPITRDYIRRSIYFAVVPYLCEPSNLIDYVGDLVFFDGDRPSYSQPLRVQTNPVLENNVLWGPWFRPQGFGTPPFNVATTGSNPWDFNPDAGAGPSSLVLNTTLHDGTLGGASDKYTISMHPMESRFKADRVVLRHRCYFDNQVGGVPNIAVFLAVKSEED